MLCSLCSLYMLCDSKNEELLVTNGTTHYIVIKQILFNTFNDSLSMQMQIQLKANFVYWFYCKKKKLNEA